MKENEFDYYSFVWGKGMIDPTKKDNHSLKLRRCLEHLPDSGNIVEIGCGAGRGIRTIKQLNPSLNTFGCDFSKDSIKYASQYNDGTIFQVCDALHLPYEDETFDGVIIFDLLEHLVDVNMAVKEIHRVLKKNGIFHCYVPCEGNFMTFYWLLSKTKIGSNIKEFVGHIQQLTYKEMQVIIKNVGFKILCENYSMHWFGQIMDIILFSLIKRKRFFKLYYQLNEEISNDVRKSMMERILVKFKDIIHFFAFLESEVLKNVPLGVGLHLTANKE